MAKHPHHIQQHRQQRAGGQGPDVGFAAHAFALAEATGFIAAVRHQLPFTGEMRGALAELVEAAGDNDRRQTAEHHQRGVTH